MTKIDFSKYWLEAQQYVGSLWQTYHVAIMSTIGVVIVGLLIFAVINDDN